MKTTIIFFEEHMVFETITTELNVSDDFIEMKLAKYYEKKSPAEILSAERFEDGKFICGYQFEYGNYGIERIYND